jgi:methyl-accepting chemotaxis protein
LIEKSAVSIEKNAQGVEQMAQDLQETDALSVSNSNKVATISKNSTDLAQHVTEIKEKMGAFTL